MHCEGMSRRSGSDADGQIYYLATPPLLPAALHSCNVMYARCVCVINFLGFFFHSANFFVVVVENNHNNHFTSILIQNQ